MPGFTTIGDGSDWSLTSILNEIIDAQRERVDAIGGSKISQAAAGDDVQRRDFWKDLQDWCLNNCTSFLATEDPVGTAVTPNWDGAADQTAMKEWTLTNFKTYIAGNSGGFRRYTTHPHDGGSPSYGTIQEGDIIDYWILQDLQKAFKGLVWKKISQSHVDDLSRDEEFFAPYWSTYAEAITDITDRWDSNPTGAPAGSYLAATIYEYQASAGYAGTLMQRTEHNIQVTLNSAPFKTRVDFYIWAEGPSGHTLDQWDANGDPVVEDVLNLVETVTAAASAGSAKTTSKVGTVDTGSPPASPTGWSPSSDETAARGWVEDASKSRAVLRWDITDGFAHY